MKAYKIPRTQALHEDDYAAGLQCVDNLLIPLKTITILRNSVIAMRPLSTLAVSISTTVDCEIMKILMQRTR